MIILQTYHINPLKLDRIGQTAYIACQIFQKILSNGIFLYDLICIMHLCAVSTCSCRLGLHHLFFFHGHLIHPKTRAPTPCTECASRPSSKFSAASRRHTSSFPSVKTTLISYTLHRVTRNPRQLASLFSQIQYNFYLKSNKHF